MLVWFVRVSGFVGGLTVSARRLSPCPWGLKTWLSCGCLELSCTSLKRWWNEDYRGINLKCLSWQEFMVEDGQSFNCISTNDDACGAWHGVKRSIRKAIWCGHTKFWIFILTYSYLIWAMNDDRNASLNMPWLQVDFARLIFEIHAHKKAFRDPHKLGDKCFEVEYDFLSFH